METAIIKEKLKKTAENFEWAVSLKSNRQKFDANLSLIGGKCEL